MSTDQINKRVLIVEDSNQAGLVQKSFMIKLNCDVDLVMTGEEGLELCEKNNYDLILMDIGLPGINGIETTRQIRSGTSHNRLAPIVAITANLNEEIYAECLKVGMNDALEKPFSPARAQDLIVRFCP